MTSSPTVKRRRLSTALKQARLDVGLDAKEAARRLGWDPTKIHRIERNKWQRPDPRDIRDLLDLYEVLDERQREALLALARDSRHRGWWADYQDVFRGSLPDFESGSAVIRTYEAMLVPGLLQTADYVRAVMRAGAWFDERAIERRVEARLARQEILDRDHPPQLWAVIDEAALRRTIGGPEVMRAQIENILKVGEQGRVAVQVLPLDAGAHAAMDGGFVILDFDEDPSLVVIETATDTLYLETTEELHRYTVAYSHVQALALAPEASARFMESMIQQL
ncbi:helix-turn-helix domain-containing protein [Nonomuraea sp. NPDC059023]|uniref:helix-turn-helix domain-containing protein n=1 Tax=unclassified Nonomuraea TaxID=2593643 RepID=UPI0036906E42